MKKLKITPELAASATSYTAHVAFLYNRAARLGRHLGCGVTQLDMTIVMHVHTFAVIRQGGTIAAELVGTYDAPRRTIRDSLARMVKAGALINTDGVYTPQPTISAFFDGCVDEEMRLMDDVSRKREAYISSMKA